MLVFPCVYLWGACTCQPAFNYLFLSWHVVKIIVVAITEESGDAMAIPFSHI